MSHPPSDFNDMAQAATEIVMATQSATLRLLEAEMQALAQMMPGTDHGAAHPLPSEEDVENGFENMPV